MSKYCCLFNHYNPKYIVSSYVYALLDLFRSLNCKIIFISNSPISRHVDRVRLENLYACHIYERENKGLDFGAWKWAIEKQLVPPETEHLFLANDSVLGPLFDIHNVLVKMQETQGPDFWSMTDSNEGGWHLQSYFMCFSRAVFRSNAFRAVFNYDFNSLDKSQIISRGERALTSVLLEAGFSGGAYISVKDISPLGLTGNVTVNPTHYHFETLITKHKFPFIKRDLILQNPENLEQAGDILTLIEEETNYPVRYIKDLIIEYLETDNATVNLPHIQLDIICHLYYRKSIYYFLSKLALLKTYNARFIFNLSASLFAERHFRDVLDAAFPESIVLHVPNKGRDVGAKIAAFDLSLKLKTKAHYTLFIHDKQSPHSLTGLEWRNKLLQIIEAGKLRRIFQEFETDRNIGLISAKEFIKNEYDPDTNAFATTSSDILKKSIEEYGLKLNSYCFTAGTIFWVRTDLYRNFFERFSPLSIRSSLETGNALDFDKGTVIHAWERLFSWIITDQGYTVSGV